MVGFEEKEMLGQTLSFAQLFFHREKLSLMLPGTVLQKTVRLPLGAEAAGAVLDSVSSLVPEFHDSWKVRQRHNQELLESGDPNKLAGVFRSLTALQLKNGPLNSSDRRQFQHCQDLLVEELAFALKQDPEQILQRLMSLCTQGDTNAA